MGAAADPARVEASAAPFVPLPAACVPGEAPFDRQQACRQAGLALQMTRGAGTAVA